MPDAIALLKADHRQVKALFKEAAELGDGAHVSRAKLFAQIDAALTLHTQVEEEIFYPAVKAKTRANSDERDEVLEAYEEHACAKDVIAKLEQLDPKDETYRAKLTVLNELIDHHVKEEETSFFPQARELLGDDRLAELGEQIEAMKQQAGAVPAARATAR
jgi:hemerythrin superfamily protein